MCQTHRWRHRVAIMKEVPMANEGSTTQGSTTDNDFKELEQASQIVFGSK